MKLRLVLCITLLLTSCATPPEQQQSVEALAEQKQRTREALLKGRERENEALRLALREAYLREHPELSVKVRKAILNEEIKVGMTMGQVVAAYSLWEYTTDPRLARYKAADAPPLWLIVDRRQTGTAQTNEQWVLQRAEKTRYVDFENGTLKSWKD